MRKLRAGVISEKARGKSARGFPRFINFGTQKKERTRKEKIPVSVMVEKCTNSQLIKRDFDLIKQSHATFVAEKYARANLYRNL